MALISFSGPRLDRLPICKFHWRLLGLIGAGMFLDGFEVYLAGGVVGLLVKTGWADLAAGAQFISAGVFGMVIGAWLAGVLGDRYGRRFSYQFNLMLFGLASFAAAAAPSVGFLIAARFFMGIGLGAEIVVGYGTLLEYIPPSHRGRWGAGLSMFMNSALFVSALCGYFVLPTIGWRWMFVAVGVMALFVWFMRKGVPESPRWLESQGRASEADRIVTAIESDAGVMASAPVSMVATAPPGTRPLFSKAVASRLILGVALNVGGNAAVYGFLAWIPTFFVKQGLTVASSLGFTAMMSLGGPVGAGIGMLVADRFDRRRMIVGLSILAAALGGLYPFAGSTEMVTLVGFVLVTVVYVFVAVAWASYVPELFPTESRLRGAGFCNAAGRLAAAGMPFAVVPLYNHFALYGVAALLCGTLLTQAAVTAWLGIETNSVPLEVLAPDVEMPSQDSIGISLAR